jgi:DNA processing protein
MIIKGNDDLLQKKYIKIAVIGSRNCSYEDRKKAEKFGAILGDSCYTLVSGLANGIDTHAHLGAIPTMQIAVIPRLDPIDPANNRILAEEILEMNGLLVAPSTTITDFKQLYLTRDRLLVDISDYVLALGDVMKGGTAYTYNYAKEEKKIINHGFIEALRI